jgi:uncharacterized DUF497 family protein
MSACGGRCWARPQTHHAPLLPERIASHYDVVVRFREVRWDDWSEDHIGHRGIGLDDVEDVVLFPPRYVCRGRDGKTLVYGTTDGGRHLLVVVVEEGDGVVFVVTARDMNRSEQRTFRAKGR